MYRRSSKERADKANSNLYRDDYIGYHDGDGLYFIDS